MPYADREFPQSGGQLSVFYVCLFRESFEIEIVEVEILREVIACEYARFAATKEHWSNGLRRYALDGYARALQLDMEFDGYLRDCHIVDKQIHHQPRAATLRHRG